MEAHTPISQAQQRACPQHFTNFLYRGFFFQHINLPCHAAKNKICKIHSGGLPTQWKLRASISMKNLFAQGETLGGLSRDGGGRNKMGLRNIAKAFNHRRAVRPGFSPTGAKRQMGSITALAGHTHTRLPLLFQ